MVEKSKRIRELQHMKTSSNDSTRKFIFGSAAVIFLAAVVFFFTFFHVKTVEVMGSDHYSEDQLKEKILKGTLTTNSILAPMFYAKDAAESLPYIESFNVRRSGRNKLIITVKEKNVVGCIPYLDSYIYFDRSGYFVEGSKIRDTKVAFFDGIQVKKVIMEEKLPIKETILNTAVALSTIFAKNDMVPDHIIFDDNYEISLLYGDITVQLGKDQYLEDKMTRAIAILPELSGQKGILHMENISRNSKTVTFESEEAEAEVTAENWNGGYDENGDYTGDGEYDENGNYVGPKLVSTLDTALERWVGGYDEEGDYTGNGEYDADLNYVGPAPTQELLDSFGDWTGGYNEDGGFDGTGEYDADGNYVGAKPDDSGNTENTVDAGDSESDQSGENLSYDSSEDSEENSDESDYSDEEGDYYDEEY